MRRTLLVAWLSHWRRHPGQGVLLILGLMLATALWTGVQAINAEARASYDRAANALAANDLARLVPRQGDSLALSDYSALRRAGWQVAPVIEDDLSLNGETVTLIGLDPLTAPALPAPETDTPTDPADALRRFLLAPGELRGHPETLGRLGAPGPVLVATRDLAPGTLVTDIGIAARLLNMPDRLSHLLILAEPGPDTPPLSAIAPALRRVAPAEGTDIRGLTRSFHLNLTAFGLLSFVVGLFITQAAIGLAFEQRRAMIRTLRALGTPLSQLITLLCAEALLVAILAGGLGLGLGYLLATLLLPDVAATLRGLYGATLGGTVSLRPGWILSGLAIALIGTALATAHSLSSLGRLSLLTPAQPRSWAMANTAQQSMLARIGLLGFAMSAGLALWGTGLIAGFASLAGLMLGAALTLPWLLGRGLAIGLGTARSPLTEWLWADARQQVPGLSLALMALLLALATNIGVSTMVASFRTTFEGWLDQRMAAEMYLRFDDATQAARILPDLPPSVIALPTPRHEADLSGAPGTLMGLPDHATYRENWPLLSAAPQAWTALTTGTGVLINEQWANQTGTGPGDLVAIDNHPAEVIGIYADYGNPRRQAVIGIDVYQSRHPDSPTLRYALRLPSAEIAQTTRLLTETYGLRPDQLVDQVALKSASRRIFERTFAATDALNVLTLAVAGIAVFASLTSLQSQRLPQIAPLWALGLSRRRIAGLDLVRSGLLALLTACLALPTGLALAWLLLARVNVQAFGWRLPMQAFPADWALLILAAVIAAVIAAALPALHLARISPARLTKVFTQER